MQNTLPRTFFKLVWARWQSGQSSSLYASVLCITEARILYYVYCICLPHKWKDGKRERSPVYWNRSSLYWTKRPFPRIYHVQKWGTQFCILHWNEGSVLLFVSELMGHFYILNWRLVPVLYPVMKWEASSLSCTEVKDLVLDPVLKWRVSYVSFTLLKWGTQFFILYWSEGFLSCTEVRGQFCTLY